MLGSQQTVFILALHKRHFCEQVSQISIGLHAVCLRRLNETVERRTGMGSTRRTAEKPVLPSYHKRTDRIFNQVRVRS